MRVKVSYEGYDQEVDRVIKKAMESIGGAWYAQGYDHTTGMRDLNFDMEEIE